MKKYIAAALAILCCFIVTEAFSSSDDNEKDDDFGIVRLNDGKVVDIGEVTLRELRNGIKKILCFAPTATLKVAEDSAKLRP